MGRIKHLTDSNLTEVSEILQNIKDCTITEKLDGSSLSFGLDSEGFYTRLAFEKRKKFRSERDFDDKNFSHTYAKFSHIALERMLPFMESMGLSNGTECDVEVLFGDRPNVISYDQNGYSSIVFISSNNPDFRAREFLASCQGEEIRISSIEPVSYLSDSQIKTVTMEREEIFVFSSVPEINLDCKSIMSIHLLGLSLESYLRQNILGDMTVATVLTLPLNKKPDGFTGNWALRKVAIKEERKAIRETLEKQITQQLYRILLSQAQHISLTTSSMIDTEGFVISGKGAVFKVIDKRLFLAAKNYVWEYRDKIKKAKDSEEVIGLVSEVVVTRNEKTLLGTKQVYCNEVLKRTVSSACVKIGAINGR